MQKEEGVLEDACQQNEGERNGKNPRSAHPEVDTLFPAGDGGLVGIAGFFVSEFAAMGES